VGCGSGWGMGRPRLPRGASGLAMKRMWAARRHGARHRPRRGRAGCPAAAVSTKRSPALALAAVGLDHASMASGTSSAAKDGPITLPGVRCAAERAAVGAGHRDLVPLAAVLVDAEDADVAAVVVAAAVDAAADVQVDVADVVQAVEVVEALGDGRGDRDRARVGQRAEITAGAGDHVGEQADVGRGEAGFARGQPQRAQVALVHPGQQQVLVVRDAQLAVAEALGQLGAPSIWSPVASPGAGRRA
jgi:hypothetical protein